MGNLPQHFLGHDGRETVPATDGHVLDRRDGRAIGGRLVAVPKDAADAQAAEAVAGAPEAAGPHPSGREEQRERTKYDDDDDHHQQIRVEEDHAAHVLVRGHDAVHRRGVVREPEDERELEQQREPERRAGRGELLPKDGEEHDRADHGDAERDEPRSRRRHEHALASFSSSFALGTTTPLESRHGNHDRDREEREPAAEQTGVCVEVHLDAREEDAECDAEEQQDHPVEREHGVAQSGKEVPPRRLERALHEAAQHALVREQHHERRDDEQLQREHGEHLAAEPDLDDQRQRRDAAVLEDDRRARRSLLLERVQVRGAAVARGVVAVAVHHGIGLVLLVKLLHAASPVGFPSSPRSTTSPADFERRQRDAVARIRRCYRTRLRGCQRRRRAAHFVHVGQHEAGLTAGVHALVVAVHIDRDVRVPGARDDADDRDHAAVARVGRRRAERFLLLLAHGVHVALSLE